MCHSGCTYNVTVTDPETGRTWTEHCGTQCVATPLQDEERHPIRCSVHAGN